MQWSFAFSFPFQKPWKPRLRYPIAEEMTFRSPLRAVCQRPFHSILTAPQDGFEKSFQKGLTYPSRYPVIPPCETQFKLQDHLTPVVEIEGVRIWKPMSTLSKMNPPLGNTCWVFAGKTNNVSVRGAGQGPSRNLGTAGGDASVAGTFTMTFPGAG